MESAAKKLMLTKLREQLNNDKIKLWLPPYTEDKNKSKGKLPEVSVFFAGYMKINMKKNINFVFNNILSFFWSFL